MSAQAVTVLAQFQPSRGSQVVGIAWAAVLVAVLGAVIWWALTASYDFRINIRGGRVDVSGKRVSIALRNELFHFFANDFPPKPRLTIYASRRRNRTYQLRFVGRVTAGDLSFALWFMRDVQPYYPFADERQWRLYEQLADAENLPPYDPLKHNQPIRRNFAARVMMIPTYFVFPFLVAPLLALLLLIPRSRHGPSAAVTRFEPA